jgi:citrate synthase
MPASTSDSVSRGLEGVVAGRSSICYLDGLQGKLAYRGIDIQDLAGNVSFEEVAHLLWFDALPTASQLAEFSSKLAEWRAIPSQVLDVIATLPKSAVPMMVLRTAVSALSMYDPDLPDPSPEANLRKALRLTARFCTIVAAYHRIRNGLDVVPPDPSLNTAANFLYMMRGTKPDEPSARAFDLCFVLHAEHELNASTFTARVIAATLADMYAAVTGAIGALEGPLHGGANEQVMEMLQQIGHPDKAEEYVLSALARKEKIMGFGHRVYRTEDPRARFLKRMSEELGNHTGEPMWYLISRRVEEVVRREKNLNANVDFYSASVYHYLGIPSDLFTPIFACSRISGWAAHIMEQYADDRLIRPRAEYVGHMNRPFVPIDQR